MAKISQYPAGTLKPGDEFIIARAGNNFKIDLSDMPIYPPGHLFGCTLSNNSTDPTNDIDIAAGSARDTSDTWNLVLASALTKRLDAAWAVGTNQGGLDTGAIANTTYHVFLIMRSDTGVVDVLFSASATAPTLPSNYDYKRRIGSIVRTGGAIKTFVQDGDMFMWKAPVNDVNATNPGTSAVTRTLTVPVGIRVEALLSVIGNATAAADFPSAIYISDLSLDDVAPTATTAHSVTVYINQNYSMTLGAPHSCMTNTSAQVRSRVQLSGATTLLIVMTNGWRDTRGRLS